MIFAVNKPVGPTSHDIVAQVKRLSREKTGHGGTLDPKAAGVLVIATGDDTKKLAQISEGKKEYLAEIELGAVSPTDDSEGPIQKVVVDNVPDRKQVAQVISHFVGLVDQIPPQFSAIKIKGKRSYHQARMGQAVDIAPRKVEIFSIDLISYNYPIIKCRIVCGKGVYIRSIARDLGQLLKTGAYLKSLLRTQVSNYCLEDAIKMQDLADFLSKKS